MLESKSVLTNRLRSLGLWSDASLWKDSKIKEFREAGMRRAEAAEKAWKLLSEKYPPEIEIPQQNEKCTPGVNFIPEQTADLPPGALADFWQDVNWAYGNLEAGEVDPENAPSAGAVALLGWARSNKNDFFAKMVPRALSFLEKQDPPQEHDQQELEEIEDLAAALGVTSDGIPYTGRLLEKE